MRLPVSMFIHRLPIHGRPRTLIVLAFAWIGIAFESAAVASDVAVQKVLTGLQVPCGVAVRPNSASAPYEIFVADRGAGRVVRIVSSTANASTDAIAGFAPHAAVGNSGEPGICSLYFLDQTRLVVAGGDENKTAFLRLYELSGQDVALKADEHKQSVDLPSEGDEPKVDVLSFHSLTRTRPNDKVADNLLVAATGEHGPAGLWKVALRANTLNDIEPFDIAKESNDAVECIAVASNGYIVIATGAVKDSGQASDLKFLNPADGHVVLRTKTEVRRIVSLAYSPTTGNLFAASYASRGEQGGGVYRIDDASQPGKPATTAVKIADAKRPTALAFGPDGALYVTTLGESGNDKGALLKLTGEL